MVLSNLKLKFLTNAGKPKLSLSELKLVDKIILKTEKNWVKSQDIIHFGEAKKSTKINSYRLLPPIYPSIAHISLHGCITHDAVAIAPNKIRLYLSVWTCDRLKVVTVLKSYIATNIALNNPTILHILKVRQVTKLLFSLRSRYRSYVSGMSRHGEPERRTQNILFRTRRSSTRDTLRGLIRQDWCIIFHTKSLS